MSETAFVNLALLGLGAVTGIITARVLGPEGRGVLAIALAITGVSSVIAGLGLPQALAYRVAARREDIADAVSLSLLVGTVVGGATACIGYVLTGLLADSNSTADAVRLGLVAVPVTVVGGDLAGIVQGMRAARPFNLLRLAPPAGYAALLAAAAVAHWNLSPIDIVFFYLLACTVATGIAFKIIRPVLDLRRVPSWLFARATLRYGLVVNVGSVALTANTQLVLVALAAVASVRDVGLYSVAIGYASPVGVAALALALHTLPDVAGEKDPRAQVRLARRRLKATLLTTLPLVVAGVIAAPFLVPLMFGDAFSSGIPAAQVLVVGQAFLGVNQVLSEISRGLGKPGLPAVAEGLGAVATVLLLAAVVPHFGLVGGAVSSATVYLGAGAVLYVGLRGRLGARFVG